MNTFVKDLIERAIKTFAQVMLGFVLVGVPVYEIDWGNALGISATATAASILTSLASAKIVDNGTASLVSEIESRGRHRAPE